MEVEQAIRELCERRKVPQLFKVHVHVGPLVVPTEGRTAGQAAPHTHVVLTKNCDEGNWPWPSTYACEDADQALRMADELIAAWVEPELRRKGYEISQANGRELWGVYLHHHGLGLWRTSRDKAWLRAWRHYKEGRLA